MKDESEIIKKNKVLKIINKILNIYLCVIVLYLLYRIFR